MLVSLLACTWFPDAGGPVPDAPGLHSSVLRQKLAFFLLATARLPAPRAICHLVAGAWKQDLFHPSSIQPSRFCSSPGVDVLGGPSPLSCASPT